MLVLATGFDAVSGSMLNLNPEGARRGEPSRQMGRPFRQLSGNHGCRFSKPLHDPRPRRAGRVFSPCRFGGELTTAWIGDCIRHLRDENLGAVEATEAAEAIWNDEINSIAGRTLYPRTDSWYMGANIPGKPRQFLGHLRGSQYFDRLSEVAEAGYDGFVLEPTALQGGRALTSGPLAGPPEILLSSANPLRVVCSHCTTRLPQPPSSRG